MIDAIDTNSASSGSSLLQVEDETKKYEDYFVIHQSISRLPAKYREVISLRFFAGKEIHEISQILDKPESSIKTLLYRGLEKLRVDIQEPVVVKMKLPR